MRKNLVQGLNINELRLNTNIMLSFLDTRLVLYVPLSLYPPIPH